MTFSDANPIQFWLVSENTYNETEVCGINPACWCQPWNLADSTVVQFVDSSSPGDFMLGYFDEDGVLIDVISFTEADDVHSATVSWPQVGLLQLKVFAASAVQYVLPPDEWTEDSAFTARNATTFTKNAGTGSSTSAASQDFVVLADGRIKITITTTITGTWTGNVTVTMLLAGGNVISPTLPADYIFTANGVYEVEWILEGPATELSFTITTDIATGSVQVNTDLGDSTPYVSPLQIEAKSDCMDVRTSHDCSEKVTYGNASDYAGLQYSSLGTPLFNVRVPAVFFHEDGTEEREDHELSNDTVIEVSSKIMRKKRFDIGFVPYYFHMKLRLVFAHQLVQISDLPWIKLSGDAYEVDQGNKRYPLKKASVLLTDKDYIKRNLL